MAPPAGFEAFAVECADGQMPVPAILDAARFAGWTVGAVGPEARTLDSVFQELQEQHAEQLRAQGLAS
jgi:hypothetical protein